MATLPKSSQRAAVAAMRETRRMTLENVNSYIIPSSCMRVARRYSIVGRVQGVGFRFFAFEAATREGLSGAARNLPDGSVEVVAEGEAEAMERFERRLRQGPRSSRVEHVDVVDEAPIGRE